MCPRQHPLIRAPAVRSLRHGYLEQKEKRKKVLTGDQLRESSHEAAGRAEAREGREALRAPCGEEHDGSRRPREGLKGCGTPACVLRRLPAARTVSRRCQRWGEELFQCAHLTSKDWWIPVNTYDGDVTQAGATGPKRGQVRGGGEDGTELRDPWDTEGQE